MKKLLFFLLVLPVIGFSQENRVAIDSIAKSFVWDTDKWFQTTVTYYNNGRIENIKEPMLCGEAPCDTLGAMGLLLDASQNAWNSWAGYNALAHKSTVDAKAIQKDGASFFQIVTGSSSQFVKAQNDRLFSVLGGKYSITTPDMPATDFTLTQVQNGACRFVMDSDSTVLLTAILLGPNAIRLREKLHAYGYMIVTGVNQFAGDQVTVNGTTLTEGVHFSAVTNTATTAINLAAAINAVVTSVTATVNGTTIKLVAKKPGSSGNSITMSYVQGTGNALTLSGNSLSGGSNSNEVTYDVGLEYAIQMQNGNTRYVFFDDSRNVKLVKK